MAIEDLKPYQFTSTNQPKNKGNAGRKPNIYNKLKESGLSKDDIMNVFRLVLEQSPKKLKEDYEKFKKDEVTQKIIEFPKDKPIVYYNLVSALLSDLRKGSISNLMSILARWIGYPKQDIGLSGELKNTNPMNIVITNIPIEELKKDKDVEINENKENIIKNE